MTTSSHDHDIAHCRFMHRILQPPTGEPLIPPLNIVLTLRTDLTTQPSSSTLPVVSTALVVQGVSIGPHQTIMRLQDGGGKRHSRSNANNNTVVVDNRCVLHEQLVHNPGLAALLTGRRQKGQYCLNRAPHDAEDCSFVHIKPGLETIVVDGVEVRVGDVLRDVELRQRIIPESMIAIPRKEVDQSLTIVVEDMLISLNSIEFNPQVVFQLQHPRANAQWCDDTSIDHDIKGCAKMHKRRYPSIAVRWVASSDTDAQDCVQVSLQDLKRNHAVDYLSTHPHIGGVWCDACDDVARCCRVHVKDDVQLITDVVNGRQIPVRSGLVLRQPPPGRNIMAAPWTPQF